jgi:hypothetical protein
VSFVLQLSMIAALIASFKVVHAIAVIIVESCGTSATVVALVIMYGATFMM